MAGCHAPALLQEHAHARGVGSARQLHQTTMAMQHRMAMPPACRSERPGPERFHTRRSVHPPQEHPQADDAWGWHPAECAPMESFAPQTGGMIPKGPSDPLLIPPIQSWPGW